jgi:hypothetical protein
MRRGPSCIDEDLDEETMWYIYEQEQPGNLGFTSASTSSRGDSYLSEMGSRTGSHTSWSMNTSYALSCQGEGNKGPGRPIEFLSSKFANELCLPC